MILDDLPHGYCIPIVIGDGPSLSGPRLGGAPPDGIVSTHSAEAHYLLTLALEQDGTTELSIFLHPDWEDIVFNYSRTLYSQDDLWIEFVVHGPSVRGSQDNYEPILPPQPLLLMPQELDVQGEESDEPNEPLQRHKLGGQPYFVRYKAKLVDAIQEIEQQGYRQLLQLTFPGSPDAIFDGDWPFGDGQFYLFFKYDEGKYHWYYGWLY